MCGWVYLIKNGDLYKIGITKNIINRMSQLKPDKVLAKSYISNYRELEKHLHSRYKKVRIPQTEYFRLNILDIRDCVRIIIFSSYFNYFFLKIFLRLLFYILSIFTVFVIFNSLIYYDWRVVIGNSLNWTEKVSFLFMFISLINKSGERLDFQNEFRYRIKRVSIYLLLTILLRVMSQIIQYFLNKT